jgi:hypothetical protein
MLGMYNQYIKNSINNSDANHKCVPCSATHSVEVRQLKDTIIFLIPLLLLFSQVAYAANELAPIPGQSAAYNAGFSQGYLGVPFKGGHTEQFMLGYINGSQGIQDDKAEVAGYMGKPFHWDKQATQYYTQGLWLRAEMKCGGIDPLGTFPNKTNDNYKQFYIGYNDGATNADNTYDAANGTGICPSKHTKEYCMGWKIGYNNDDDVLAEPDNV